MAGAERGVRARELLIIAAGSGTGIKTRPDLFGLVEHYLALKPEWSAVMPLVASDQNKFSAFLGHFLLRLRLFVPAFLLVKMPAWVCKRVEYSCASSEKIVNGHAHHRKMFGARDMPRRFSGRCLGAMAVSSQPVGKGKRQ
jgi:hypothetical protein